MVDAALSAFSVFFTPSPSFLAYQRSLEQAQGNNNARTLFDVHNIPSDNPIRSLLDATPPGTLKPVYAFGAGRGGWIPAVPSTARCCWPSTGQGISPGRAHIIPQPNTTLAR